MGTFAGYGKATFIRFRTESEDDKTTVGNAAGLSAFYEATADTSINFRIELQYTIQQPSIEVTNSGQLYYYHRNVTYLRQQLNCNLDYIFRFGERAFFNAGLVFGLNLSSNINTYAIATGKSFSDKGAYNSNGDFYFIETTEDLTANDHHSKDLGQFGIGLNLGLELAFRMSDRVDLLVQGKYNLGIITGIFAEYVNIGLRRRIGK